MTLHKIKQIENISSAVSVKKIGKILEYLTTPVQVVLHNTNNGRFNILKKDCSIIHHGAQKNRKLLHLGHYDGHYFLIEDVKELEKLTTEDFKKFDSKDDILISQMNTNEEIKNCNLTKVGG